MFGSTLHSDSAKSESLAAGGVEDDCVVQALLRVQPVLALPHCEGAGGAQQLEKLLGIFKEPVQQMWHQHLQQ